MKPNPQAAVIPPWRAVRALPLTLVFILGVAQSGAELIAQISDRDDTSPAMEISVAQPDGPALEAFTSGPFGDTARFGFGVSTWYAEIPHHVSLNPTGGFTFEAWIQELSFGPGEDCRSIAGKNYLEAWWIGSCTFGGQRTLRSYLHGGFSVFNAGTIPTGEWAHIAVTWDGTTRRHYINGQLIDEREEGPPTTSLSPMRIGSDVSWALFPDMRIDEVRLWSRALNHAEVNQWMRFAIRAPKSGLVAVWSFDDTSGCGPMTADVIGARDGAAVNPPCIFTDLNAPIVTAPDPPAGTWLTTTELPGFRFKVRITAGVTERIGTKVNDCVPETLCVAGAIPSRSEIFFRIIGPRPNNFMWAQGSRFTISQVEAWIEEISTGQINYYKLDPVDSESDVIDGFNDRFGFVPD